MVSRDVIAQLHQDITTADNSGDRENAERLRGELATAIREDAENRELPDLTGAGSAPQPPESGSGAGSFVRRAAEDLGPGSYEQSEGIATDAPGSVPPEVQEPPD
ncbi:hypothetical protein ACTD5D_23445 [Nocardia takedensis]|uniref:hypothetical protein n=1 Tax=Nocardia takedensis TaxID=259390 RepID=UPI0003021808|nr:hypothetical protein [Nocardia takedensis]